MYKCKRSFDAESGAGVKLQNFNFQSSTEARTSVHCPQPLGAFELDGHGGGGCGRIALCGDSEGLAAGPLLVLLVAAAAAPRQRASVASRYMQTAPLQRDNLLELLQIFFLVVH